MAEPLRLIRAAQQLRAAVDRLQFAAPVSHVYNPLVYAWEPHADYLRRFGPGTKRVVFLGMNPGPFGMAQTGVPFGEVAAVRDWLGVRGSVSRPEREHPRRPITGFACHRSEVSGRRLWGLFAERFGDAECFFKQHIVLNYCPLVFIEESGRNRTPDKLAAAEKTALFAACDAHLRAMVEELKPAWLVAVGDFAFQRASILSTQLLTLNSQHSTLDTNPLRIGRILHPSPASPAANRDWAAVATRQLVELGVWHAKPH
jgi:single-strand selective monofunctional uracil DNA glycosylase